MQKDNFEVMTVEMLNAIILYCYRI